MIVKPLAIEIAVTTADTVYDGRLIRIYADSVSVITIADANSDVASFTAPAGSVTFVEKTSENTISGSTSILCTPVSYKS